MVLRLAGVQLADAAFNAVALYRVAPDTRWARWATDWTKEDLDRLGFPGRLRFVFPIIKTASAAGLLAGLRRPALGRLTASALVAYFVIALGFHRRAKDSLTRTAPAWLMLLWSAIAFRVLSVE
jgi:hypothetical protein